MADARSERKNKMKQTIDTKQHGLITLIPTYINNIKPGDTIYLDDELKTVSKCNIRYDSFMGHTLFGDSFILGTKPVLLVEFTQANKAKKEILNKT
jgi:hypothetical protein